jgi:EmrB/QacA subfamily drug resistance transporter
MTTPEPPPALPNPERDPDGGADGATAGTRSSGEDRDTSIPPEDRSPATGASDELDAAVAVAVEAPGVDEEAVVPWSLLWRRWRSRPTTAPDRPRAEPMVRGASPWVITWTVLLGALAVASTITILAVSRPVIAADLRTDAATLVWLISGPTIAVGITGTTAGKLGDLHGHRRVYLASMIGATVFALLAGLAWSAGSLIAFRVVGATIGAATGPSSLAIISQMFPRDERSKALGFWSLVVAGGPVLGLVIGGPLVERIGWRAIFFLQTPLLAAAAVAAFLVLPETRRHHEVTFDVRGQIALALSLGGLLLGIDRAAQWGLTSPWVAAGLAVALLGGWWFVRTEQRVQSPLIPLGWLRRRSFAVPIAVGFFIQFGYMGGFILAPKLLAEVSGYSADAIAFMMVPRPLTFAVAGPVAGMLAHRFTARSTVVAGVCSLVLSLLAFAWVAPDPSTGIVVVALALSGVGIGAAQPRVASAVANSVGDKDLGIAGAAHQLVSQVGTTLGMNGLESVQVATVAGLGLGASYRVAYLVGALVAAVGIVVAAFLVDVGERVRGRG